MKQESIQLALPERGRHPLVMVERQLRRLVISRPGIVLAPVVEIMVEANSKQFAESSIEVAFILESPSTEQPQVSSRQ